MKTIKPYNPSAVGVRNRHLFGLPEDGSSRKVVCIPVPWEATASYGRGTARAPKQIVDASVQLDLWLPPADPAPAAALAHAAAAPTAPVPGGLGWQSAPGMGASIPGLRRRHRRAAARAGRRIARLEAGRGETRRSLRELKSVNQSCRWMTEQVTQQALALIRNSVIPAVVGGDHSSALGLLTACHTAMPGFGVLIFDAHLDLREAYEGFRYSHASVFYNALSLSGIQSLTYVGARDFCDEEWNRVVSSASVGEGVPNRSMPIHLFTDRRLFEEKAKGRSWETLADTILATLPESVYISFDADALQRQWVPHTGTPVPGGLSYNEALFLIRRLKNSGRRIIAFDLCETGGVSRKAFRSASGQWDASVAARLLFELGAAALHSQTVHSGTKKGEIQ